jgi:hypothetical protein
VTRCCGRVGALVNRCRVRGGVEGQSRLANTLLPFESDPRHHLVILYSKPEVFHQLHIVCITVGGRAGIVELSFVNRDFRTPDLVSPCRRLMIMKDV